LFAERSKFGDNWAMYLPDMFVGFIMEHLEPSGTDRDLF
jgi:hypothetical protein